MVNFVGGIQDKIDDAKDSIPSSGSGSSGSSGSSMPDNPLDTGDLPGVPDDPDLPDQAPDNPVGNFPGEPADPVETPDPAPDPVNPIPDPTNPVSGIPGTGGGSDNDSNDPAPAPEPSNPTAPNDPIWVPPTVDRDTAEETFQKFKDGIPGADEVTDNFRDIAQGNIDQELENRLQDVKNLWERNDQNQGFNPQDIIPEYGDFSGIQFPDNLDIPNPAEDFQEGSENLKDAVAIGAAGIAATVIAVKFLGGEK